MKPLITSIEKDISGCHYVCVLYPQNREYEYKIKNHKDMETIRFLNNKGFTGKWVKFIKRRGEVL